MFALGIVDKLTPGALTGGKTSRAPAPSTTPGTVGAIGGIRRR